MKSDLTCPVEITKVTVNREMRETQEKEDTKEREQVVCLIEFFNLSEKAVDSLQMNIICFDEEGTRLGGRLVRAGAAGEPREHFSGTFMPEHVDGVVRVEAAVEKVWFKDGVIWRREDRNVREYTPNNLNEGRELDRLRAVAGLDAAGYAREDDIVWMCVCGRANRTSDDICRRCERKKEQVLAEYSFAAIDATAGEKERELEKKTQESLRRSSETTVREQSAIRQKSRSRRRAMKTMVVLLALCALALAVLRWGLPYGASVYGHKLMDEGRYSEAREAFAFVASYWPGEYDAKARALEADLKIVEGFMRQGDDASLEAAAMSAKALEGERAAALYEEAMLMRAELAIEGGDTGKAEALLGEMPESEEAAARLKALVYSIARDAHDRLDYETAIARYESLGGYEDAAQQARECVYDYGRQLMREGQYQQAHEQLLLVADRADAISLIRQCRYAIACDAQENGDYIAAADMFETLGVYEDAETRAKLCRYTAGMNALGNNQMEVAAEQLRLAEDHEDAKDRFADVVLTLGNAALANGAYADAMAWLEQLPREGEAGDALNRATYAYARELEEAGQLEAAALEYGSLAGYEDSDERVDAIEYELALAEMELSPATAMLRFEGLGDYKDAKNLAKACRYRAAIDLFEAGDYENALAEFELLGGYEDAKNQVRRSRYAMAGAAMDDGRFEEAAALFEACGAYLDAEDRVMRAQYARAQELEERGEYEAAAAAFAGLGSYEDAKLRVTKNEDAWLLADFNSARMDTELGDYAGVIRTLAPYWQAKLPERFASMADMYESACFERAQILIEMGRPLDALPLLEEIKDVSKNAAKKLDAYVFRIIGRWKDARGVEYIFRRDGSCSIAGEELYFGGSGYGIAVGAEPYPAKDVYSVVSLRNKTLTIKNLESKSTVRLSYVGEPTEKGAAETAETEDAPAEE